MSTPNDTAPSPARRAPRLRRLMLVFGACAASLLEEATT